MKLKQQIKNKINLTIETQEIETGKIIYVAGRVDGDDRVSRFGEVLFTNDDDLPELMEEMEELIEMMQG